MGIAIGDFDTDGRLDALKTHFAEDTVALYRNAGHLVFEDVTLRAGLGVETRYVGWGDGIADLDNDGLPDLFWVTGSTFPEVERKHPEFPHKTPRVLFRNLGGGRFEELLDAAGSAIAEAHSSRGVAFGDFDNDGDLDILIMNMNEPPSLLRNDVRGGGHWLKVKLVGTRSNASAIGAVATAAYGGRRQAQAQVPSARVPSVQVEGSGTEAHFSRGVQLMQEQMFEAAAGEFEQALSVNAADPKARFEFAVCLLSLGRNDEARKQFEQVQKLA